MKEFAQRVKLLFKVNSFAFCRILTQTSQIRNHCKVLFNFCFCFCFCILGMGCGTPLGQTLQDNVNMDVVGGTQIYYDNWVRKTAVQTYVHPDIGPAVPPKVLFMPLRMTQSMEYAQTISTNLSRIIWQTWTQNKVLEVIEFANTQTVYRPDLALALARQKGADMVFGGYITHYVDGSNLGDSAVSIALEGYDVKSGNLLWSMAQGGIMPRNKVSDYLLFSTKTRMPADPATAIVVTLATDMGLLVRNWAIPSLPPKSGFVPEPKAFQ